MPKKTTAKKAAVKRSSRKVVRKEVKTIVSKKRPLLWILIISLLLVAAGYFFLNRRSKVEEVTVKIFSLEEIAQHATADNCWMAIKGRVYDVTSYVAEQVHPGGKAIVKGCGKEATEMWNNIGREVKKPHSSEAMTLLQNFYIGNLE